MSMLRDQGLEALLALVELGHGAVALGGLAAQALEVVLEEAQLLAQLCLETHALLLRGL